MFSLRCAWTNDWANSRESGDLIRNSAHYDVAVMALLVFWFKFHWSLFLRYDSMSALVHVIAGWRTGLRFNIKMTCYQNRKSHCGDKTILRPSYLHNGISCSAKMTSLYWIGALATNHYLSQRRPSSLTHKCIFRPQWVRHSYHFFMIKKLFLYQGNHSFSSFSFALTII